MWDLLGAPWGRIGIAALSAVAILAWVIVVVRIIGLRSFAKMSSFDFATTVAIGSTMATVALTGQPLVLGVTVIAVLLLAQATVALGRRSSLVSRLVDNEPMLLMVGQEYLDDNLRLVRVTRDDVRSKLREANVYDLSKLRAVVLESTGDISVLHGDGPVSPEVLQDVRDGDQLIPT